jgi:hypothetical protein
MLAASSQNSQDIQAKQKEKVTNRPTFKPSIPGDYDSAPASVPSMPAGVEGFGSASVPTMFTVGYMSTLVGAAALFFGLTRLLKSA